MQKLRARDKRIYNRLDLRETVINYPHWHVRCKETGNKKDVLNLYPNTSANRHIDAVERDYMEESASIFIYESVMLDSDLLVLIEY